MLTTRQNAQTRAWRRGFLTRLYFLNADAQHWHLEAQLKKIRLDCVWEFMVIVGKHRIFQEAPVTVSTAVCLPLESSASPVSSVQQIYCCRLWEGAAHTVFLTGLINSFRKIQSVLTWCPPEGPPLLRFQAAKTSRSDGVEGLFDEGTVKNNSTLLEMSELFDGNSNKQVRHVDWGLNKGHYELCETRQVLLFDPWINNLMQIEWNDVASESTW